MTILTLLGGFLLLMLLFVCKKTRALAWTLLGLGAVGLVVVVLGYAVLHEQRFEEEKDFRAREQARAEMLRRSMALEQPPVDLDLFEPRIELGEDDLDAGKAASKEARHAGHASHTVEAAVEAPPPEPSSPPDSGSSEAGAVEGDPPQPDEEAASTDRGSSAHRLVAEQNEERPEWVDHTPRRDARNYPVVVVTDPFLSKHEADRQVGELIMIATSDVVSHLVGDYPMPTYMGTDHRTRFNVALAHLRGMGLTPGRLHNEVWRDEYVEHLDLGLPAGPMVRVHTLLEFDQDFQDELQLAWREGQARERLSVIGVIAAGVLGVLALVWGVLKFDTATKGYYTKRLLIGGTLVTMIVVVLFSYALN